MKQCNQGIEVPAMQTIYTDNRITGGFIVKFFDADCEWETRRVFFKAIKFATKELNLIPADVIGGIEIVYKPHDPRTGIYHPLLKRVEINLAKIYGLPSKKEIVEKIFFSVGHELRHDYQYKHNLITTPPINHQLDMEDYNNQWHEQDANRFGQICMAAGSG